MEEDNLNLKKLLLIEKRWTVDRGGEWVERSELIEESKSKVVSVVELWEVLALFRIELLALSSCVSGRIKVRFLHLVPN